MKLNLSENGEKVNLKDVALTILLALFATSLSYRFGSGNQLEHIPTILRQLDPTYLSADFFVSTSVEFGPRFYFARFIALVCHALPLAWTFYIFTLLTDIALVVVTLWAARVILGSSRLGGMLAAVLVLGVSGFHLGDATQIRYEIFQPASLAIPAALWVIGLGLCGRPVIAALVASVASLAHPLYGVQSGGIALVTAFAVLMSRPGGGRGRNAAGTRTSRASAVYGTLAGAVILLVATLLFWWLPLQIATTTVATLSSTELIDILARFRSPHHYFPSYFRPQDFVTTGFFLMAMFLAYSQWSQTALRSNAICLLIPPLVVFVACVVGTVFTELWPIRAVFTLQPFRLLSILKWVGFLLIGWQLALYLQRPANVLARPLAVVSLLSSAGTQPVVTAAALTLVRYFGQLPFNPKGRAIVIVMWAISIPLWVKFGSLSESLFLVAALGLVMASFGVKRVTRISGVAIAATLGLVLAVNASGHTVVPLSPMAPVFDFEDLDGADAQVARQAAATTPVDAVFVVPPAFGALRILGPRAIVVDFKAIPLQDEAMREWRERIRFVYGDVEGGGFAALTRLDQAYRTISDARLLEVAERYGATHALLYADTTTALAETYSGSSYKVVRLMSH